jgi:regulator of protease activity HflC (stomatin/prohibitin superfamily)
MTEMDKKKRDKRKRSLRLKIKLIWKRIWYRHKIKIIVTSLLLAFFIAYFWNSIFIAIPAGSKGVQWKRFHGGTVMNKVYDEGLHVIFPWNKMTLYSLRVQEQHNSVKVLTTSGLYVDLDISYRFFPERDKDLPKLHVQWGPDYAIKFVEPEAKAATIAVIGEKSPQDLYSLKTTQIQMDIEAKLKKEHLNDMSYVKVHDFLITRLALPDKIRDAIENKLTQKQLLEEYKFRVAIEEKEKERRRIEAQGISLFEQISGISILKWRGLAVTSEIAKSQNTKVVIVGTSEKGLPVILNADK